jgi:hypothetical protein
VVPGTFARGKAFKSGDTKLFCERKVFILLGLLESIIYGIMHIDSVKIKTMQFIESLVLPMKKPSLPEKVVIHK